MNARLGLYTLLGWLWMFGCQTSKEQPQDIPVKEWPACQAYVTPGGDRDFVAGELRSINTAYCLLFDRMTDSTEVWLACYEFTLTGVFQRLIDNLRLHPGAKARLLFDPKRYTSEVPSHRLELLDSLRHFAQAHPQQLTLVNEFHPDAGWFYAYSDTAPVLMHSKFMVITHLSPFQNDSSHTVSLISTANLSYAEAGESNEVVLIPDHPQLAKFLVQYFEELSHPQYFPTPTEVTEGGIRIQFFPQVQPKDPVQEALANLAAQLPRLDSFVDPMRIRVAISHWDASRLYLADQLVTLGNHPKVDLKIVLREDLDISPEVYGRLRQLGPEKVRVVPARSPDAKYGIHSKLMIAEFPSPEGMQYRTWMGSHNWNAPSLLRNSELFVELPNVEVYVVMFGHHQQLWDAGLDSTSIFDHP